MCGIVGFASLNKQISEDSFNYMRDTLIHRGPDGEGSSFFNDNTIAFGHRRLSIVDLSEKGKQPMFSTDENICITFNGEIYNFKELKESLKDNYNFNTGTDTEVLINAYIEWGVEGMLERIEGMFAFAIYDKKNNKIFIVRDRVGIKPLYYYQKDDTLVFASELKAIMAYPHFEKKINPQALASYFSLRYIIAPLCIYQDCNKLLPGHYMIYDTITGENKLNKYWELPKVTNSFTELEAQEAIKKSLEQSVEYQTCVADVPVHTFLSGGIDSSFVSALVKKYANDAKAYSIEVVDKEKNEIEDAKFVANHLKIPLITEKLFDTDFDDMHNEIIAAYDEPLADTSNIPTYFLSKLTSKHVKVALSGDGGDELFYGYNWYNKIPDREAISAREYFNVISNTLNKSQIEKLFPSINSDLIENLFLGKDQESSVTNKNAHRLDFYTFMVDDILTKVDTASMCHSLEVRVPFLDRNLIELAFSIDPTLHHKNNELKYLLKKAGESYLPKETLYKKKKGFSVPSVSWLKDDIIYNILNGFASKDGIWNKDGIRDLLKGKLHEEHSWLLYNFERWYAINFHDQKNALKPSVFYKLKSKLR